MCVTLHDFLNFSEIEQRQAIVQYGNIMINYLQGDTIVNVYKVKHLFVKVCLIDGKEQFIVYKDLSDLKLFDSSNLD